ncbi:MAG TPA: hypothetical protein VGH33_20000 [Isosphaeraceae bacterium]
MADIPSDIDFTRRNLGDEVEILDALRGVDSVVAMARHKAAREALADFILIVASEGRWTLPGTALPLEAGKEWLTTVLNIPIYAEDFAAPGGIREAIREAFRNRFRAGNPGARPAAPLAMRMMIARPLPKPDRNADVFGPDTPRIDFFAPAKFVADVGRPAQPEFLGRIALDMAYQEVAPRLGDAYNQIPWPDGFAHMVEAVRAAGGDVRGHGVAIFKDEAGAITGLGVCSKWRAQAGDFGVSVFDEHNRERILIRKGVAGLDDAVIVYPVEA